MRQLPDGTQIWTLPGGQTYVTTPGSALLFPALMTPTPQPPPPPARHEERGGDKTIKMPRRTRTRRQNRAAYIAAERAHNRTQRLARHPEVDYWGRPLDPPPEDSEPPPF